jgi:hypothetical protein
LGHFPEVATGVPAEKGGGQKTAEERKSFHYPCSGVFPLSFITFCSLCSDCCVAVLKEKTAEDRKSFCYPSSGTFLYLFITFDRPCNDSSVVVVVVVGVVVGVGVVVVVIVIVVVVVGNVLRSPRGAWFLWKNKKCLHEMVGDKGGR